MRSSRAFFFAPRDGDGKCSSPLYLAFSGGHGAPSLHFYPRIFLLVGSRYSPFFLGTGAAYNERSERGVGPRILSAKQAGKDDEVREIDATVSVEIKARLKVGIALA